jgi:hypothetical protein
MSATTVMTTADGPLDRLPSPAAIQDRLGKIVREERLLRRLLTLSMAAREEKARRAQEGGVPEGSAA